MTDEPPTVKGRLSAKTNGVRTVRIVCPYCGKGHTHGAPDGPYVLGDAIGHRVSHCAGRRHPRDRGYYIVVG